MGLSVFIEMDSGTKCPHWFTQTDSKNFAWWWGHLHAFQVGQHNHISSIAAHLGVDTGPLKTADHAEEYDLAANLEKTGEDPKAQAKVREMWAFRQQVSEASWHPPATYVTTLEVFLDALHTNSDIFKTLGIEEDYFVKGYFEHDLSDILTAARWAQEKGETAMRLAIA